MGFYDRVVLPRLTDWCCGSKGFARLRARLVPQARGTVLEIGMGSGRNLPFYDRRRIDRLIGLEPHEGMRALAGRAAGARNMKLELLDMPAEQLALPDGSVDTVLVTYALCTIPDARAALENMARVLRPDGQLLFLEHGAAPDRHVRRWQDRLTPAWRRVAGGCHLNRPIESLIEDAGFAFEDLHTGYQHGPRPMSFTSWGRARI